MKRSIPAFFILLILSSTAFSQWQKLNSFPATNVRDIIDHSGFIYGTTSNAGMYVSYDGGISFIQRSSGLDNAQALQIYKLKFMAGVLFAATVDGIYRTSNDGVNWIKKSDGIQIGPGSIYMNAFSLFEDEGFIFAGTFNSIYRSSNSGETWTPVTVISSHYDIVSFIKFNNTLYAGTSASNRPPLVYSGNNGANWTAYPSISSLPGGVFCMYSDSDTLFAGTASGMYATTNYGANWLSRNSGMDPDPYLFSIVKSGNTMIGGLNFSVIKSTNNGITWTNIEDNLTITSDVNQVLISNNKLYITQSNGIYYRNLSEIVTDITNAPAAIPDRFLLSQNYPNPFNPSTKIDFELLKSGNVKLTVYDVNGKEVKTLVNKNLSAGFYSENFNGQGLGSGIYYYKLEVNGSSETKKMLLVK